LALTSVWHQFSGRIDAGTQETLLEMLSTAGIKSVAFTGENGCKFGLVFFEAPDPTLYCFLRETGRREMQRVIAVSTGGSRLPNEAIWSLLSAGASDVLSLTASKDLAGEITARFERWQSIDEVVSSPLVRNNLVGRSSVWIETIRQIVEVGRFTDLPVLITGESGTGKEMVARLIHTLDGQRSKRNLVVLDCTTIVSELSGSEFFGHERGAFTGAVAPRDGAFALADGGTLFLDEVGELPPTLQAELLRVVQERTYKRVGSNDWRPSDFRLICATNRDLLEQERRGEFRRDFYHRIAAWVCHLPPLASRVEDILILAQHFLKKLYPNEDPPEMDDAVRDYLVQRAYPGNVRELYQLVRRIACTHVGRGPITAGDLPASERLRCTLADEEWRSEDFQASIRRALMLGLSLKEITDATIETAETLALGEANDNTSRAAKKLGINERTLQMHRASRRQHPIAPARIPAP